MLEKGTLKVSFPVITLDKRIINEPLIVLVGYTALAALVALDHQTFLRVGLGVILAIFGSGASTVAVLFPRSSDLDLVERIAFSACLSLAVGGILSFALARSQWGLHEWPFFILVGLYNLICYILAWYRRRNYDEQEAIIHLDIQKLLVGRKTQQGSSTRFITAVLIIFFISGVWALARSLHFPTLDHPMTEFYLLGEGGQAQAYPQMGYAGEMLTVAYGIVNRENAPGTYQVKAYLQGEEIGQTQAVYLEADERQTDQLEFYLPDSTPGQTKVEFTLYRDEKPYRFLHLWIDVTIPSLE